jgi:hypothetical protein
MDDVYLTSYCNRGHNTKTGRPIQHECRIIPPAALRAERDGDVDKAINIIRNAPARVVVGRGGERTPKGSMPFIERDRLSLLLVEYLHVRRYDLLFNGVTLDTLAGPMVIHFSPQFSAAIFCRFLNPAAAQKVLHGNERVYIGSGHRLNPYSGKWNFHFGNVSADEALGLFKAEFEKVRGA